MAPTQWPFTLVRPRGVWSCHAARDVLWPGVGTVSLRVLSPRRGGLDRKDSRDEGKRGNVKWGGSGSWPLLA